MESSRTLKIGGVLAGVSACLTIVLTSLQILDRMKSSEAAPPAPHSTAAGEHPAAESLSPQPASSANNPSSPQPQSSADATRLAPSRNRAEKSIQNKSTTIDDDDGGG